MSYKTDLQSNNTDLRTILDMVNSLPTMDMSGNPIDEVLVCMSDNDPGSGPVRYGTAPGAWKCYLDLDSLDQSKTYLVDFSTRNTTTQIPRMINKIGSSEVSRVYFSFNGETSAKYAYGIASMFVKYTGGSWTVTDLRSSASMSCASGIVYVEGPIAMEVRAISFK